MGRRIFTFFMASLLIGMAYIPWAYSWTLYDDFNVRLIDPTKWHTVAWGALGTETKVGLSWGELHIIRRGYGDSSQDQGKTWGGCGLHFADPQSVRGIKARVRVVHYRLDSCSTNESGQLRARLGGFFFNSGEPIPGSRIGDVWAACALESKADSMSPSDVLDAVFYVYLCADDDCSDGTVIDYITMGTANVRETVTLLLEWDEPGNRFIAQMNDGPEYVIPYDLPDSAPPGDPQRRLEVQHAIPNGFCGKVPIGYMDAAFDDVFVLYADAS